MKHVFGLTQSARRRAWIAASAVCGLVVMATSAAALQLDGDKPSARQRVETVAKPETIAGVQGIPLPKVKWKLTWADEFNGKGTPDPKKWTALSGNGTNGWSHHSLHYYRAANNLQDGKGNLVITAAKTSKTTTLKCWNGPCKYTSGRIQTHGLFSQTYGRFTARMKLPTGKGMWPAFWLQREAGAYGEIDVAETIGSRPNTVQGFAHAERNKGGGKVVLDHPLSSRYHVYGVDWTPTRIVWWVDGKAFYQLKKYSGWPFNKPFQVILNLQVGGDWPGSPDAKTVFPARMTVDWIRVYRSA